MDVINAIDLILLERLTKKKDVRNFIFSRYSNDEPAKICNEYFNKMNDKYKTSNDLIGKSFAKDTKNTRVTKVTKVTKATKNTKVALFKDAKVPDELPECMNEIIPNYSHKPLYNYTKEWVNATNIIAPIKKVNEADEVDKAEKVPDEADEVDKAYEVEKVPDEAIIKNNYMIDIFEGVYTITINTSLKIELDTNDKRFILTDETAEKNKVIMDLEI